MSVCYDPRRLSPRGVDAALDPLVAVRPIDGGWTRATQQAEESVAYETTSGGVVDRSGPLGLVPALADAPQLYPALADERGAWLKRLLQVGDVVCLLAGWSLAFLVVSTNPFARPEDVAPLFLLGLAGIITALSVIGKRRLWLARVCAVRSAELQGLGAAAVISTIVVLAIGQITDYDRHDLYALLGPSLGFAFLLAWRTFFTAWLKRARRAGRHVRRIVIVGTDRHTRHIETLLACHPGTGFEVVGVCGRRDQVVEQRLSAPWMGTHDQAVHAVTETGANGALLVASALGHDELNRTARALLEAGCHVHVSSALSGISHERLLPLPLAREPLFYLEHSTLSPAQHVLKRLTDVVLSSALMVAALPVLAVVALLIKLDDGGPVMFRQRRVGHRGTPFTLYKLRTMVVDAEKRRAHLEGLNGRADGPLFKLDRDPRITRVGWWLRITSLDELPQLFNVFRGDMSLVGPRPALPDEVAHFDDELRRRDRMMPGLTGLWQVEGRDDPSFDSYRRLDLYYVENWSVGLDLAILCTTVGVVAKRGLRMAMTRSGAA